MNDNELKVLKALLDAHGYLSAGQAARESGLEVSAVQSALVTLEKMKLAEVRREEKKLISLSKEGERYARQGTPERRLVKALRELKEAPLEEVSANAGLDGNEKKIALQWAFRNKWVKNGRGNDGRAVLSLGAPAVETREELLLQALLRGKHLGAADASLEAILRQRGLVSEKVEKSVSLKALPPAKKALEENAALLGQLTPQMLKDGSWRNARFREYGLETVAAPLPQLARKHVYREFLERMKTKLVGMGFREVRGSLVEMEFWNMDALFMPQDHPARDIHDVFKIRQPREGEIPDEEVFKAVYSAHKGGDSTGSRGWRYPMSKSVSQSLILRSHDTGISARNLFYDFRSPDRVFFFAHVFRPDEIDWKHFIEFNQLGGYVTDESMSFREMLGYLKTFAVEVFGAKGVRFLPTYYPFTEPSVTLNVEIPGKGWAEVGGAGMFRPEMLCALGVKHPVIAWGLGIDRLAMLTLGITDIRELNSHKIDFLRSR
ncbi:phenylalanine--tRNA ligase subunit alpha [Candidatus Micrarchaeota archaeon]|nr:phenylalanine--tRNA ligase subunit alpha [Candidatus Micrarchaeota archaeon]